MYPSRIPGTASFQHPLSDCYEFTFRGNNTRSAFILYNVWIQDASRCSNNSRQFAVYTANRAQHNAELRCLLKPRCSDNKGHLHALTLSAMLTYSMHSSAILAERKVYKVSMHRSRPLERLWWQQIRLSKRKEVEFDWFRHTEVSAG